MQRAFAVSLGIPPSTYPKRQLVQISVVSAAVRVNLQDAIGMIKKQVEAFAGYTIRGSSRST